MSTFNSNTVMTRKQTGMSAQARKTMQRIMHEAATDSDESSTESRIFDTNLSHSTKQNSPSSTVEKTLPPPSITQ